MVGPTFQYLVLLPTTFPRRSLQSYDNIRPYDPMPYNPTSLLTTGPTTLRALLHFTSSYGIINYSFCHTPQPTWYQLTGYGISPTPSILLHPSPHLWQVYSILQHFNLQSKLPYLVQSPHHFLPNLWQLRQVYCTLQHFSFNS